MSDKETLAVYDAKVDDYARLTDLKTPDEDLQRFLSALPPGARVLDLGCGPGRSAALIRDAGHHVDAVDGSAAMVEAANATFDLGARQMLFSELDTSDAYHAVWANFSLLHASKEDFARHLEAIHRALVTGGLLHLGMKLGTGADRDGLGRFYSYYSVDEMEQYLDRAGFSVEQTRTGEGAGLAGQIDPFVIVLARRVSRDA